MQPYGTPGKSQGVVAFDAGPDFILVRFVDGRTYRYGPSRPGADHVERMKALALAGEGLTTYISKFVRGNYEARE